VDDHNGGSRTINVTEGDYLRHLQDLLEAEVPGMSRSERLSAVRRLLAVAAASGASGGPSVRFIPFVTGRRPALEARRPGLGSSDHAALLVHGSASTNRSYLLYEVRNVACRPDKERFRLEATLYFTGVAGDQSPVPLPGWAGREVRPLTFATARGARVDLTEATGLEGRRVLVLEPDRDLHSRAVPAAPGLGEWLGDQATDGDDPYTFGHLFAQRVHCELRLRRDDDVVSATTADIDVCDSRRLGSLYRRVVKAVVRPDAVRQFKTAGAGEPNHAFHPWFPVLRIGRDKGELYMRALMGDIVHKHHHLTDPRWLLRVGLYLEFLTCIGIFEAVRDDVGDVLTPAERRVFERAPAFAGVRERVNPRAWKRVWRLREIVFRRVGIRQTGPVSAANLLKKREATLAFLEVHHNDLKHAIELAGPNLDNAQETWYRVFRDAERAVLRQTPRAFPELTYLGEKARRFLLWHRRGHFGRGVLHGPEGLGTLFGDQDGLLASACNQYRASMNEVAGWSRDRGLMDFAGAVCVPPEISLLEAYMNDRQDQLARLQRRDGYAGRLDIQEEVPVEEPRLETDEAFSLVRSTVLFRQLTDAECRSLAETLRPIALGPMERILVQGRPGSSLFLVANGEFEVLLRQPDGTDLLTARVGRGAVLGETSLLTGAPRSATVRAGPSGGLVFEIGKSQYEPIVQARAELVEDMARLMAERAVANRAQAQVLDIEEECADLRGRIRKFFFGV
jgi:CRP-like cAMP-binding protein